VRTDTGPGASGRNCCARAKPGGAFNAHGNEVIKNLTFHIPAGKTLSVVGPSGCGKTTLIRAIAHFIDETFQVSGEVSAGRSRLSGPSTKVGVVMQDAPVFNHMTVWDNVTFGNSARTNHGKRRCWRILGEFGLALIATQRAGTLSGGQRQRLALATAIANSPALLLVDEPFGALDAITRRQLQRFFWQHVHGKITALFVTHDLEEALLIGDRVMIGVGESNAIIETEKDGLSVDQWEFQEQFSRLRAALIKALEHTSSASSQSDDATT
jgi:ABC-type nitrate/sulfonate/bicarbonate transport system ATPase subunit